MPILHTIYDIILSNLSSYQPQLIYFSVGSALGHWDKIKPNENQQYPFPILGKYKEKKKVIILMDQQLESPLKMESDIKLHLVDHDDNFRILTNEDTIVFAINHHYYFEENPYLEKYEFERHFAFLMDLISFTLSNNNKLIIQNFAGQCIQNSCVNMFNYFPKNKLIANVIFDVSNSDGNCGFDFDNFPIRYDEKDNFIQIKFHNLSLIKKFDPKYFSQIVVKRIDSINYSLTRKLRVIRGELEMTQYENNNIQNIVKILSIIYPEIKIIKDSSDITEDTLMNIMKVLITDICQSLNVDKSIVTNLVDIKFTQKEVINSLSPLKSLL
jgi:hypothetical protein